MAEKTTVKPMTTAEWIDYAAREIEKLKWFESAKAYAESLRDREKEMEKATRARDAAVTEREEIVLDIQKQRTVAHLDADQAKSALAAALKGMQDRADRALAATEATHAQVKARMASDTAAADQVRVDLDRLRTWAAAESTALQKRVATLQATEDGIKERLAAALGR